jgi:hypothetical protein
MFNVGSLHESVEEEAEQLRSKLAAAEKRLAAPPEIQLNQAAKVKADVTLNGLGTSATTVRAGRPGVGDAAFANTGTPGKEAKELKEALYVLSNKEEVIKGLESEKANLEEELDGQNARIGMYLDHSFHGD